MSEYNYTCACCGKHWHATSTGRKPTKAALARMVCQPCREASKRIAALEAENAGLREKLEHWLFAYCGLLMAYRKTPGNWLESEDSENWRADMKLAKGGKG